MDYNDWFEYRTNVDYVMTDKGTLVDPNRPTATTTTTSTSDKTDDYRYDDNQSKETIQQKEERLKQEMKQLEEDKKKLKQDSIKGNGKVESMDDEHDGEIAGSPVFSLVQIFN